MNQNIINLKKQIIYRCSYTGTKESDYIYKKIVLKKINTLTFIELKELSNILLKFSDNELFLILTNIKKYRGIHKKLFNKLINE